MILTHHGIGSLPGSDDDNTANIGGRKYRIVTMPDGNIWMAENLDLLTDGLSGMAYYYNNDESTYGISGDYKCGLLYNGYGVQYLIDNANTLIPGWHVATVEEWNTLLSEVGGSTSAGTALKAQDNYAISGFPINWNGSDSYGFSVVPSGALYNSIYYNINTNAYFWTGTYSGGGYYYYKAFSSAANVSGNEYPANRYLSVRLVKD